MSNMVTTTCAKCGQPILVNALDILKEEYPSGIERTYWVCPHEGCGQEYTVMLTDEAIRNEFKKRAMLINVLKKNRTEKNLKKIQSQTRKINRMLAELNTADNKASLTDA